MSSRQRPYETFYYDRSGTQSQAHSSLTFRDRLTEPTVVITVFLIFATILYNQYGSTAFIEGAITSTQARLWNTLVHLTPSALLEPVDAWLNPESSTQPMVDSQTNLHARKSETMKRVLGLDRSGGMMATVFQARTRALSTAGSALGLKYDSDRPAGLGNRDNSCFQNSILQGLASLRPFQDYLSACLRHSTSENADSRAVTQTLQALLLDLNDASNNGRTLWTPQDLKFMSTWQQQDAQEYYSKILDDIDKVAATVSKANKRTPGFESDHSIDDSDASQHSDDSGYQSLSTASKDLARKSLRNPLEGLGAQRVSCTQCGYSEGLSMSPFNCLTLSLGLGRGQHDLNERLDAYSHVEAIEGVECAKCTLLKAQRLLTKLVERLQESKMPEEQLREPLRRLAAVEEALEEDHFDEKTLSEKCKITSQSKVNVTKTKQVVIARPPQSLAIHMQRSVFDPSTFNMIKNSAPVYFPMTLDLGPWCLGSARGMPTPQEAIKTGIVDEEDEEQWLSDPEESMIAGGTQPSTLCGPIYDLSAVVTHAGRHENGHYICYRKFPRHSPPVEDDPEAAPADENGDVNDGKSQTAASPEEEDAKTKEKTEMEWWRLSDHNVSRVEEEVIFNLSTGVFMLFYDCIDSTMVLQSENEGDDTFVETRESVSAEDTAEEMPMPAV